MKYLAFDCSSSDILVCAVNEEKCMNLAKKDSSGTEHLMETIDEGLRLVGLSLCDIDYIGVSVGPGSWTGARVAVVTALGILAGLKKQIKIVKFNAFDLISYNEIESDAVLAVKAYANFVYIKKNGECRCVEKKSVESEKIVCSEPLFEGVQIVERNLKRVMDSKIASGDFASENDLEPMYLRLSQAEIQLANKRSKNDN